MSFRIPVRKEVANLSTLTFMSEKALTKRDKAKLKNLDLELMSTPEASK